MKNYYICKLVTNSETKGNAHSMVTPTAEAKDCGLLEYRRNM
jgi:hypothetical protein